MKTIRKIVCIDPGHGGRDPGAVANSLQEKQIALEISLKLAEILKLHDFKVVMTRKEDIFVSLNKRADIANRANADIFISVHCNSAANNRAYGFETYHYPRYSDARRLATYVQEEIQKNRKLYQNKKFANRGVKTARFTVLQRTSMTAILVETAFINNAIDAQILKNNTENFAFAIANAVLKYFNISKVEENKNINFFDDKEHWAYDYCVKINEICAKNNVEGISETRFDDSITRGEAMKLIALTLEIQSMRELKRLEK